MSFIVRTENLASAPELRESEKGPYGYATLMVSDRIRQKDGTYLDGPATAYNVAAPGDRARHPVACAQRDGNVCVSFARSFRVSGW